MSKLGIIINRTHQGLDEIFHWNRTDDWVRNTRDTRDDLSTIRYPEGPDDDLRTTQCPERPNKVVYMMTFNELGCYFCIMRGIAGRIGDNVAAWIFIPREINIPTNRLQEVITKTTECIREVTIDNGYLRSLFEPEYPSKDVLPEHLLSSGNDYAYRYYGQYFTLQELSNNLYQSYYSQYKAVFLLDELSGMSCNGGTDLSENDLHRIVTLNPPQQIIDSFVPYFGDKNQPFSSPVCVALGQTVTVRWKCSGYEVVNKSFVVDQNDQFAPSLSDEDCIKIVSRNEFHIFDPDGNQVSESSCDIYINKIRMSQQSLSFKKTDLSEPMQVKIQAQGFEEYSASHNLLTTPPITINLKRKRQLCQFFIPKDDNSNQYIHTELIEFSGQVPKSPFKGYTVDQASNPRGGNWECYLKFEGNTHQQGENKSLYHDGYEAGYNDGCKKFRIGLSIAALSGLTAGILLTMVVGWLCQPTMNKEQSPASPAAMSTTQEVDNKSSSSHSSSNEYTTEDIDKANAYLNTKTKWNKTEMENFKPLKGLFDALNSYDSQQIHKHQGILHNTGMFETIDKMIINANKSGQYFTTRTDTVITVESYIKALDPKPTESKPAETQPANGKSSQKQRDKKNK